MCVYVCMCVCVCVCMYITLVTLQQNYQILAPYVKKDVNDH